MLLEAAWDYDFEARGNIVDMHIHRLRKKVDEGFYSSAAGPNVEVPATPIREPNSTPTHPDQPA